MIFDEELVSLEKEILQYEEHYDSIDITSIRGLLRNYIGLCCHENDCSSLTIADAIEIAASTVESRRKIAIVILRCLSVERLIPKNNIQNQIDRKIVNLIESSVPDICKFFKLSEKKQTFDKISTINTIHHKMMEEISILKSVPPRIDGILSIKTELFSKLNNKIVKAYLNIYDYQKININIISIINGILQLEDIQDDYFGVAIEDQNAFIESQLEYCEENTTFFNQKLYLPFLLNAKKLLSVIVEKSKYRFECNIKPQKINIIEKRYPLHEAGRKITIPIGFTNKGPGMALNVGANMVSENDNVFIGVENVELGNIPPGDFSIVIEILINEKTDSVNIILELTWGKVSSADRDTLSIEAQILSQDSNIDWTALSRLEPYSTETAEGDEFVGRKEKILSISNRLLKTRMQSTYITGQKRVGKSSLSLAVKDNIILSKKANEIDFFYLEWGDYSRADPSKTVRALGEELADFLLDFIPSDVKIPELDFEGTLAPLNKLSNILLKKFEHKKFVFIIDEFDEIHQEMYRYGSLAETFFSNIRSLGAKKNIAFILVGGENMPFIISSQGDQLNKFIREPLDYFNRTTEWVDYVQLIKKPVKENLNWYDTAITELFNITNGNPFYTKLLCRRIYSDAIKERDIEITANEVNKALNHEIPRLDTNAFSHIWKDGISADRREEVVYELKRCRFLIALARTLRREKLLIPRNIYEHEQTGKLQEHEILPLINDHKRRGILIENENGLSFKLPIFQNWLVEEGINKLISDKFAEEIEEKIDTEEEAAFVTTAEIADITESFPSYKGQKISSEDVRAWLNQIKKFSEQRLLFKLLANLRFFSEYEIREKLKLAHRIILSNVEPFVRKHKSDRRTDILITYVDSPGKSGSYYASRYAEENIINSKCVIEPTKVIDQINENVKKGIGFNGLVIIDDIAATGKQLSGNLNEFLTQNLKLFGSKPILILTVVITATKEGEEKIRKTLSNFKDINIDIRVCEPLNDKYLAFKKGNNIWRDNKELEKAKDLCKNIGVKVYKKAPLGYGTIGLLVVFPNTCPNNTLPVLHSGDIKKGWRPLFQRPKN